MENGLLDTVLGSFEIHLNQRSMSLEISMRLLLSLPPGLSDDLNLRKLACQCLNFVYIYHTRLRYRPKLKISI